MSDDERDRRRLASVFSETHRSTQDGAPSFSTLWRRAERDAHGRARGSHRRRRFFALAAGAASLAVAVGLIGIRALEEPGAAENRQALEIAASLSDWQAPLDFLLQTPGREWLRETPRLGADVAQGLLQLSFPEEKRDDS